MAIHWGQMKLHALFFHFFFLCTWSCIVIIVIIIIDQKSDTRNTTSRPWRREEWLIKLSPRRRRRNYVTSIDNEIICSDGTFLIRSQIDLHDVNADDEAAAREEVDAMDRKCKWADQTLMNERVARPDKSQIGIWGRVFFPRETSRTTGDQISNLAGMAAVQECQICWCSCQESIYVCNSACK